MYVIEKHDGKQILTEEQIETRGARFIGYSRSMTVRLRWTSGAAEQTATRNATASRAFAR
jgi:hypothetical protein